MVARDALHEMGSRMITKVRTDIADPNAAIAGFQVHRVLIGRLVQHINLL